MTFTLDKYLDVVKLYIEEWTRRSTSPMLLEAGKGCFIWDSVKDGERGSGWFYTKEMLSDHFSGEMVKGLERMIDEANHERELVVALIFGKKVQGLRLGKLGAGEDKEEIVPSLLDKYRGHILDDNPKLDKYEELAPIPLEAIRQVNLDIVQYLFALRYTIMRDRSHREVSGFLWRVI